MNSASGTDSTMQITVTATAMPRVRRVTARNTASVSTRTRLSVVTVRVTAPVKLSVLQNAETRRTASDPRYAMVSQASGGTSSSASRARRAITP